MKYIIMCGGKYDAFTTPRHLTIINNEPLAGRTIRLLKELGVEDISISTTDERFKVLGVPILSHTNTYEVGVKFTMESFTGISGYWVDAFYPTYEPTCYLMGDVFYSKEALKQIIETDTDDILFFGTQIPFAPGYSKWYEEPLAFKVVNVDRFRDCIKQFKWMQDNHKMRRHPISWELYRIIDGIDVNTHKLGPRFIGVHYFTEDIDTPEEAKKLEEIINTYHYE